TSVPGHILSPKQDSVSAAPTSPDVQMQTGFPLYADTPYISHHKTGLKPSLQSYRETASGLRNDLSE
ncbi:hypothetical protein, partial [Faecalibaculum rodentium]|uniref:hypothetical protein n=1 Tax=Faecalibaculum rodentium TaxID=1702221 RepID=UPI0025B764A6